MDDDELLLQDGWLTNGAGPYLQLEPLSGALTIADFRHAVCRD